VVVRSIEACATLNADITNNSGAIEGSVPAPCDRGNNNPSLGIAA
jgi:hypothetical protein